MNFKFKIYILALFTCVSCVLGANACNLDNKSLGENFGHAVIKNPVVDMYVSFPVCESIDIPAAPDQNCKKCCRTHQGLYNETVKCLEDNGDCVKIVYDDIIYGFDDDGKARDTFWVYKKYLVPFLALEKNNMSQAVIGKIYAQEPTVFLTYPFASKTGEFFSVGTRFKRAQERDRLDEFGKIIEYAVIVADYENNKIIIDYVPVDCARVEIKNQDAETKRKLFVEIVSELVDRVSKSDNNNSVIRYVWGGSSFTSKSQKDAFYQKDDVWYIKDKVGDVCSGYDCSELVMRMAKMAGINFPWKTTVVMEKKMAQLAKDGKLENGDIIWVPGHVMIISNKKNNELIHANGYSSGYGCLQKIKLRDNFEGIETYDQLLEAYFSGRSITRLKRDGQALKTYDKFKILKLID